MILRKTGCKKNTIVFKSLTKPEPKTFTRFTLIMLYKKGFKHKTMEFLFLVKYKSVLYYMN